MKKGNDILILAILTFTFFFTNLNLVLADPKPDKGKPINYVNLPRTGQVEISWERDDGDLRMGVEWPDPRFVDNNDGTVTDRLTRLVWLKNAVCFGAVYWYGALEYAKTLQSGDCGLSDYSIPGDWRMPNRNEMLSLTDASQGIPAIPLGHPFTNLVEQQYWTSTTAIYNNPAGAWLVYMYDGRVLYEPKSSLKWLWPVRSGM